jgi:hypothetical protein
MEKNYFIKSYCRITNEKIICDGELILENQSETISEFLKVAYKLSEANYPKFHKMDLLCKASFIASEFISQKINLRDTNTALILSNKNSSWVSDEKHAEAIYSEDSMASPAVFVYTLPNIALGEISIRHQLFSENLFLIFDKFSPEKLIPYTQFILQENKAEMVLTGWVEVEENKLDVLIYLVGNHGETEQTKENVTNLYLQK